MSKSNKPNPLSIDKFRVAKLNNPSAIRGGNGNGGDTDNTNGVTQTDGNNGVSTLICLSTNGNG